MAGFPSRDHDAFMSHWTGVMADPNLLALRDRRGRRARGQPRRLPRRRQARSRLLGRPRVLGARDRDRRAPPLPRRLRRASALRVGNRDERRRRSACSRSAASGRPTTRRSSRASCSSVSTFRFAAMSTPASDRVRVRREPERGRYARADVDAVLDAGLVAHVAFVHEGQPICIPTLFARVGDGVLVHGSSASRTLRTLAAGAPACVTVTVVDGLVLARSVFEHSVNYRSAVLLGSFARVETEEGRLAAYRAFTEKLLPGRWDEVRAPSAARAARHRDPVHADRGGVREGAYGAAVGRRLRGRRAGRLGRRRPRRHRLGRARAVARAARRDRRSRERAPSARQRTGIGVGSSPRGHRTRGGSMYATIRTYAERPSWPTSWRRAPARSRS